MFMDRVMSDVLVRPRDLRAFYQRVLKPFTINDDHMAAVVDHLISANLWGVDSHGLQQIRGYTRSLTSGRIKPDAAPHVVNEQGNMIFFDGDGGAGQYVGQIAMNRAIREAKEHGLGMVAVRNSNHYGMAGYYTRMACTEGLVGFSTSDTNVVDLAPYGNTAARVGNNPYSWGVPTGTDTPIVLDAACGSVSGGKIKHYGYHGLRLPSAWGLDREGRQSTEPDEIVVSTADSFKGSGLALILDLICGPLLGTLAACHKNKSNHDADNGTGHLFMAIDPAYFGNKRRFYLEVEAALATFKSTDGTEPANPIYYPGQLEMLTRRTRERDGIPVPSRLLETLEAEYSNSVVDTLYSPA